MADIQAPYEPLPDRVIRQHWMTHFGHRSEADRTFDQLAELYREPGRYYHTLEHGLEVATAAHTLASSLPARDLETVCLAAWTHDACYEPSATDNEAKSADRAANIAQQLGFDTDRVTELRDLILVSTHRSTPKNELEQVMCDADLASLAKPWTDYANDVANIRAELQIESIDEWHALRHLILDFFENKTPLYYVERAAEQWHTAALANFVTERAQLTPTS